jgi:DNA-binding NtrC family response regulator
MKILLSWLAFNNDYEDGRVLEDGPTANFHHYFYEHDQHLILSSAKAEDIRLELLLNYLHTTYPDRDIQARYMHISDVIDLMEIKPKVERLLTDLKEHEVDIFISPGTPTMQVAWHLCHLGLSQETRLWQVRGAKFTRTKKPELLEIVYERSQVPVSMLVREQNLTARPVDGILMTPAMQPLYERAGRIAQAEGVTTLIIGDTGTGKEHLAEYIHKHSARKGAPFVALNCSAFSDSLLESRLFGHRKGAFTGADSSFKGCFEQADGGTVFLDEIGDISPYMQQALLRVLQEKEIQPLGDKARKVNVRVLAATHRDLPKLCEEGKFRWDLYYRLNVADLRIPSLVNRGKEEIGALLDHFLKKQAKVFGRPRPLKVSKAVREQLFLYPFPGNVRELENMVSAWYVFCDEEVKESDLPARITTPAPTESLLWRDAEKVLIQKVLTLTNGNQSKAKDLLGYGSINTFKGKLKSYGLESG